MKTILIIEPNWEDACSIKAALETAMDNHTYQIKIFGKQEQRQAFYDSSDFLSCLADEIKQDNAVNQPVTGLVLGIFLTSNERQTLVRGSNYNAQTSRQILDRYGNCEHNGIDANMNIVLMDRFPQYLEYADTLSGDDEWGLYYCSKHTLTDLETITEMATVLSASPVKTKPIIQKTESTTSILLKMVLIMGISFALINICIFNIIWLNTMPMDTWVAIVMIITICGLFACILYILSYQEEGATNETNTKD